MKLKIITIALLALTLTPLIAAQIIVPVQAIDPDFTTTGRVRMLIYNPKSGKETLVADTGEDMTFNFVYVGPDLYTDVDLYAPEFRHYRTVVHKWETGGNPMEVRAEETPEIKDIPASKGPKLLRLVIDINNFGGHTELRFMIRLYPS